MVGLIANLDWANSFLPWISLSAVILLVFFLLLWAKLGLQMTWAAGLAICVIILAIVLRSVWLIARYPDNRGRDVTSVLLSMLGLVIVIAWISQGVLATQLSIKLSAQASQEIEGDKTLLVVTLLIQNTGVRQTEIQRISLFACPSSKCSSGEVIWGKLFDETHRKERNIGYLDEKDLGFGPPVLDCKATEQRREFKKADTKYYITWGTQEMRQVAFYLPNADYYDVRLSLGTGEAATESVNKWRASIIVPMEMERIARDLYIPRRIGKSIEQERAAGDTKSTFELLKRFVGGGKG